MRPMSVISGHPISTGFFRLTGCQRDPRDRDVTSIEVVLTTQGPSVHFLNMHPFTKTHSFIFNSKI